MEAKTPVILTSSQLLTTGVDAPTCKNVVLARVVGSMSEFKQIIGRGTRLRDDYGKLWFNILDYTGSATRMFADPDFDGDPARITEEEVNDAGETTATTEIVPEGQEPDAAQPEEGEPVAIEPPTNGDNRRDVIATVFKGVDNRMKSGYLLRDIINKVGGIHFTSSDELHTLGSLYESMLREMRDAAGDSGEFYTPRAVVRFMVEVTDPRLGETVLDPASGTGGFLVETYNHLEKQVKTVADRKRLQSDTITGCEPKSLPYLLCQMNLLLHGLDAPQIDPGNALRFKLSEIGEKERVDVILTNPPFGGEEEKGIQGNFPEDRQTSETALLFLQLIMRKLKRQPTPEGRPARAAVVVPNGTLFGDGVCARIKEELLKEFSLHTIVRLPNGVFAPYTSIPTNILFFDRSGATKDVWYYELPLPEGRKNYTKTQPMQFDEFKGCMAWWAKRKENDQAWKVPVTELLDAGCNLDRKNPRAKVDFEHLPPDQLADDILEKELRIAELMREIKMALGTNA